MKVSRERDFVAKDYWEQRLTEKWGLHGVGQISYGLPYNQWLYRVRKHVFRRSLRSLGIQISDAKVLDVGSGTGFWLEEWKRQGAQSVTGSDLTEVAVMGLRRKHPDISVLQLDITDSEAPQRFPGGFDIVSAFDVLFHITDDEKYASAITNIAHLLRPKGYFIFSDNLARTRALRQIHEVDRTIGQITEVLERNGLRIQQRVPVFVLMNAPFDALSGVPRFLWRAMMSPVRLAPPLGHAYGATLFPLELLLSMALKEGLSTQMIICQKSGKRECVETGERMMHGGDGRRADTGR